MTNEDTKTYFLHYPKLVVPTQGIDLLGGRLEQFGFEDFKSLATRFAPLGTFRSSHYLMRVGTSKGMIGFVYALDQDDEEIAVDFNAALGGGMEKGDFVILVPVDAIEPV
jgi:hypothetical protein